MKDVTCLAPYKVLLATIAACMPVTLASEQFSRVGDKAETKMNRKAQARRLVGKIGRGIKRDWLKLRWLEATNIVMTSFSLTGTVVGLTESCGVWWGRGVPTPPNPTSTILFALSPYCNLSLLWKCDNLVRRSRDVEGTQRRSEESSGGDVYRGVRCTPDWSDSALNGEHLWVPTSASGDLCYVGEPDCSVSVQYTSSHEHASVEGKCDQGNFRGHFSQGSPGTMSFHQHIFNKNKTNWRFTVSFPLLCFQKHGPRMKCSSCKIISHTSCISLLMEKVKFTCKPTFRDVGVRQYREQTCIHHHWVHRRTQKGRCKQCSKSFQSKLSFSSKEIVALSCTWCKMAYHNKETCFNLQKIGEECTLGSHGDIIVPPSWIVKLPRQGSFKSSLRKSPKKKTASKKKSKEKTDKDQKTFVIKPIPSATVRPVLVFINPKSGGNQGAKLLQKFQWLLNPRQVFDLTQGGPRMGVMITGIDIIIVAAEVCDDLLIDKGVVDWSLATHPVSLELFRKAPNLRVLACGGDGTVGWILSVLDQINITPAPPVGVLPLGTGNDLARALGWGGGYTDEPISKILSNIAESEVVNLDRWELKVEKNPSAEPNEEGKDSLPLSVVNNYFSLGVDAHIALEFHEAREAHPERFNSRLRNKMFYGQAGGKDLLRRKWKGLAELVTLECDGKDLTSKLKEHKVHAIVFLNIPRPVRELEITRDHATLVRFRTSYNGFYEQASLALTKKKRATLLTEHDLREGEMILPSVHFEGIYGGGTHPWNRAGGNTEPATDDGLIEVVGLTTYQLPLLQAGGHGTCITQCKSARIVTTKTIPMQVDGEACKLTPSIISLSLLNKVPMLAKCKGSKPDLP
uniref:Diacylglycerol kinase n=1 Tax=Timema bartmani TaxID=61472 RepID=A0A7R9EPJ4_9NEOP|nr:unnamed protein product [Timema bartmani]